MSLANRFKPFYLLGAILTQKNTFSSEDDCGGEGYRVTRNKFFMEGDLLVHDHYSYAKDCDGPLETYHTRYAQASDTVGTLYLTPVWFKEDGFQRDTFAESMGY